MVEMNHEMKVTAGPRQKYKRRLKAINNSNKTLHLRCYSEVLIRF